MTKDARFVPGAGAIELRLADALQQYGEAQPGLDQYAITKFGLALEVVPRTLAENAGIDAAETIAAMYKVTLALTLTLTRRTRAARAAWASTSTRSRCIYP